MKKQFLSVLLIAIFGLSVSLVSCKSKPKDADIKASIETALRMNPMSANTRVDVKDGVATISGECKDELCKAKCAEVAAAVKGVKSVVNYCTVAPAPPPVVVVNSDDMVLSKGLADALKDQPGVQYAVRDGKIVLTGEISKAKWVMLKPTLDKMMSKGYDLSKLTIK
ncbi:MAG: BON domain-containing protein [Chitinophagaceae bacterium]